MLPPKKRSPATYSVPGACRSLEFAISEILFKEPAALCIPAATVGNEITSSPAIGCANGIISPGQQDERTVTWRAPQLLPSSGDDDVVAIG
jgi:hypothetical protein